MQRTKTTKEVANYLRLSYDRFRNRFKSDYKNMPREFVGREWRYNLEEVMKFIEERFN